MNAICPCCRTPFEPTSESVEIDLRLVQELGRDRIRNLYCGPCGKKIVEKGLDSIEEDLQILLRTQFALQTPLPEGKP